MLKIQLLSSRFFWQSETHSVHAGTIEWIRYLQETSKGFPKNELTRKGEDPYLSFFHSVRFISLIFKIRKNSAVPDSGLAPGTRSYCKVWSILGMYGQTAQLGATFPPPFFRLCKSF